MNIDKDIEIVKNYLKDSAINKQDDDFFKNVDWEMIDLGIARAMQNVLSELEKKDKEIKHNNETLGLWIEKKIQIEEELETYKKIAERYEKECRTFRAFCRRVRKDEKRNVDEFNQGREYAYIQFLNLINGEQNWEHEGKHFDEVDQELENWARKEVENGKE